MSWIRDQFVQRTRVAKSSCHLFDPKTHADIATYALSNSKDLDKHTALITGRLYRGGSSGTGSGGDPQWYQRIISESAQGRVASENVSDLQTYLLYTSLPQGEEEISLGHPLEPDIVLTEIPTASPVDDEIVVVPEDNFGPYTPAATQQQQSNPIVAVAATPVVVNSVPYRP